MFPSQLLKILFTELATEIPKNETFKQMTKERLSDLPEAIKRAQTVLHNIADKYGMSDLLVSSEATKTELLKDRFVWTALLPGMTSENIEVSVKSGVLKVTVFDEDRAEEDVIPFEYSGKDTFEVEIPEECLNMEPKAKITGGILQITIMKAVTETKSFNINVSGE